jgi:hypothetical protein
VVGHAQHAVLPRLGRHRQGSDPQPHLLQAVLGRNNCSRGEGWLGGGVQQSVLSLSPTTTSHTNTD